MNPWNQLLEAFHSALIDELTERHPEPKPELGLPRKQSQFAVPETGLIDTLAGVARFEDSSGIVILALDPAGLKALKLKPAAARTLWDALLARATREFKLRHIAPSLAEPKALVGDAQELPAGFPRPGRVIWFPFRVSGGRCYLGIAI